MISFKTIRVDRYTSRQHESWKIWVPAIALFAGVVAANEGLAQPPGFPLFGASNGKATPESIGAFEGMRSGLESIVRSASQSTSEGPNSPLIDAQTARSMEYDNQIKGTNTYFQKRRLNGMYRDAEKGPTRTSDDYARLASEGAPGRLMSSNFDSRTGELRWPAALRTDLYLKAREQMNSLFTTHVEAGGGIDTDQYAAIQRLAELIQDKLRSEIKTINSQQYTAARNFLESLKYEARFPVGT